MELAPQQGDRSTVWRTGKPKNVGKQRSNHLMWFSVYFLRLTARVNIISFVIMPQYNQHPSGLHFFRISHKGWLRCLPCNWIESPAERNHTQFHLNSQSIVSFHGLRRCAVECDAFSSLLAGWTGALFMSLRISSRRGRGKEALVGIPPHSVSLPFQ